MSNELQFMQPTDREIDACISAWDGDIAEKEARYLLEINFWKDYAKNLYADKVELKETIKQIHNAASTVTRRFGLWKIKPGTKLWAIEKGRGLKKGQKVVRICMIRIVSAHEEQVQDIRHRPNDLILEGFPDLTTNEFIRLLCKGTGKNETSPVNRIEFEYI